MKETTFNIDARSVAILKVMKKMIPHWMMVEGIENMAEVDQVELEPLIESMVESDILQEGRHASERTSIYRFST